MSSHVSYNQFKEHDGSNNVSKCHFPLFKDFEMYLKSKFKVFESEISKRIEYIDKQGLVTIDD